MSRWGVLHRLEATPITAPKSCKCTGPKKRGKTSLTVVALDGVLPALLLGHCNLGP